MKTFQVTIVSIIALALSGCAAGYYQRGYAGYNRGYSSPGYYQSFGRSYYSPGASFSYGREYVQPSYRYEHREFEQSRGRHHDWSPSAAPRLNHQGGWNGGQDRDMGRETMSGRQYSGQSQPWGGNAAIRQQQQQMPERHGYGFGEHRGDGPHQQHGRRDE